MTVIIVSGSRYARTVQRLTIEHHLSDVGRGEVTLVHGDAPGVDSIAALAAARWGWTVVAVPADWQHCDTSRTAERGGCPARPQHLKQRGDGAWYCPYAGNRRNQQIVDDYLGADFVLAFPAIGSAGRSGTWDLVHRAADAGLSPRIFPLAVQRPGAAPMLSLPESE